MGARLSKGKTEGFAFSCKLGVKVPSGFCEDRKPVFLSTPSKRPDVTVWLIGSSLRQVTVVPTFTVVVEGLNISELRLITGPAGADVVAVGAVIDDSAFCAAAG